MLRLLTLGGLSVHGAGGPLAGATAQPRRLAVLALLARGGARGVSRAKLLALLWPDASDEQGRRVVTQALYALRRDLGDDRCISGTQDLRLATEVIWCDVEAFDSALERGEAQDAAALYAGPFLDGFRLPSAPEFERWADDARAAIQHRLHDALERLARDAEGTGALDHAIAWWRRRAADDPLNARVALHVMRVLAASGDRSGALRHARFFEALSAQELGLPADRVVLDLAATIRRDAHAVEANPPRAKLPPRDDGAAIAVLPFAHLGVEADDDEQRRWRDGLAEEMIGELTREVSLRVLARTASFSLGASPGLAALRAEPGIALALEGSVRRTAGSVRVTARLLHVAGGHSLWSERFECPLHDGVSAQDQVARTVAERVRDLLRGATLDSLH